MAAPWLTYFSPTAALACNLSRPPRRACSTYHQPLAARPLPHCQINHNSHASTNTSTTHLLCVTLLLPVICHPATSVCQPGSFILLPAPPYSTCKPPKNITSPAVHQQQLPPVTSPPATSTLRPVSWRPAPLARPACDKLQQWPQVVLGAPGKTSAAAAAAARRPTETASSGTSYCGKMHLLLCHASASLSRAGSNRSSQQG